ncbi:hypothetical protein ACOME3_001207 [Neoechinorhynchus agilis]
MTTMYHPWISFTPAKRLFYRARLKVIARCAAEMLISSTILSVLIGDCSMALIREFLSCYTKRNVVQLTILMLRVGLFSPGIHIIMFYITFQSLMNFMAEVTGELDREFYYEWWNFEHLMQYWNRWNQPVHRYLKDMIYVPFTGKLGFSRLAAGTLVFVVSAMPSFFSSIQIQSSPVPPLKPLVLSRNYPSLGTDYSRRLAPQQCLSVIMLSLIKLNTRLP